MRAPPTFRGRVRPLVKDGGLGTELLALAGFGPAARSRTPCLELLNATRPELVRTAHERFLGAGADVVFSNTFCASRSLLDAHGLADRAEELARLGAEIAVQAARGASTPAWPRYAFGTLGPGAAGPRSRDALERDTTVLFHGLAAGGVDALVVETARDPDVTLVMLTVLCRLARESAHELPVLVSWSVDGAGRLATGEPVERAQARCEPLPLALVALNCSAGPTALTEPLARLAEATAAPLGAWPNAGIPSAGGHPVEPAEFAAWHLARRAELDLALCGGCCGAGPGHIAALSDALGPTGS